MRSLYDFLTGKFSSYSSLPDNVTNFLLAVETGWTIEYIESLPYHKWKIYRDMVRVYAKAAPRNQQIKI